MEPAEQEDGGSGSPPGAGRHGPVPEPQGAAGIDKQQLLQQLLAVAAAAEGAPAPGGELAGLPPLPPAQHAVPLGVALPPFAALPVGVPAPPTAAPKLSLVQLLQAQLAANTAQREATPEQLEAAPGEEMLEAGQQQWEEEEEEEGEGEGDQGGGPAAPRVGRRERNRQAAARYRQRQKEQLGQVAAQLEAAQAQRTQLLAEREQLDSDHLVLSRMEAVQRDLHQTILQLCHPEGGIMAAALAAAASGTSPGPDKLPAFPSGEQARLVEQAERRFAEELRQVVDAGDSDAQATAVLQLLPATHRAALESPPAVFTQQCSELQRDIYQLLLPAAQQVQQGQQAQQGGQQGDQQDQQAQQAQRAQRAQQSPACEAAFPVRLDAMHKCAVLRKLLMAMALAAPSPNKLLHLVAASSSAPPGIWRDAADALRPTVCPQQLEELRHARHQWVGNVGRLLVARNYRLSRPHLRSWQAAAAAAAAAGTAAAGGQDTSEPAALLDYGGMAGAAAQRDRVLRELRGLDDTSQHAFGSLIALIIVTLQVMTLWQCTMLLAACYPHFPDPAAILAQLLDSDADAAQQAQQVQVEELPAEPDDASG